MAATSLFISSKIYEIESIYIKHVAEVLMSNQVHRFDIVDLEEMIVEKAEWDLIQDSDMDHFFFAFSLLKAQLQGLN